MHVGCWAVRLCCACGLLGCEAVLCMWAVWRVLCGRVGGERCTPWPRCGVPLRPVACLIPGAAGCGCMLACGAPGGLWGLCAGEAGEQVPLVRLAAGNSGKRQLTSIEAGRARLGWRIGTDIFSHWLTALCMLMVGVCWCMQACALRCSLRVARSFGGCRDGSRSAPAWVTVPYHLQQVAKRV